MATAPHITDLKRKDGTTFRDQPAPPTVEYFRGPSRRWFVRIVGANGEKMCVTQSYGFRSSNAQRAADRLAWLIGAQPPTRHG